MVEIKPHQCLQIILIQMALNKIYLILALVSSDTQVEQYWAIKSFGSTARQPDPWPHGGVHEGRIWTSSFAKSQLCHSIAVC